MKKLSKTKKIVILVAALLLAAILGGVVTMFLYISPNLSDGVNDDIRFKISYFDYENYLFKNGDTVMPFRLKSPANAEEGKTYPLCIFLHGGGSQAMDNIKSMCGFYLNNLAKYGEDCYVIVPQVPSDERDWDAEMLATLDRCLDEFVYPSFQVDVDRVYLSGSSMGGRGAIYALTRDADRYAAVMADAANPTDYSKKPDENGVYPFYDIDYQKLAKIPMLFSHGALDDVCPLRNMQYFVGNLKLAGAADTTLKIWDGLGHETVYEFYGMKENWDWMFAQRRKA